MYVVNWDARPTRFFLNSLKQISITRVQAKETRIAWCANAINPSSFITTQLSKSYWLAIVFNAFLIVQDCLLSFLTCNILLGPITYFLTICMEMRRLLIEVLLKCRREWVTKMFQIEYRCFVLVSAPPLAAVPHLVQSRASWTRYLEWGSMKQQNFVSGGQ